MEVKELIEVLLDFDMDSDVEINISTDDEDHIEDIYDIDSDMFGDAVIVIDLRNKVVIDKDEYERLQELE